MGILPITLALLAAVAVLCWLSNRARVAYPIVLVLAGLAIALVPGLPHVELHPDVVFLLFVPPLLYRAATTTNLRQFRRDLRIISLLAVGLVLVTMAAVAAVAHWMIGLPWAVAFVLGAIVSPTDALASTVIMRRLHVPRRLAAIVEGESLVNDAAALIAYRFAVAAVLTGAFSLGQAGLDFIIDSIGGIVIGCVIGWISVRIRPKLGELPLVQTVSLLVPFAAYIPADELGLSGVLAVVAAGLYVGSAASGSMAAKVRMSVTPAWDLAEFVLNGLGFILIGLQLPFIIEGLDHISWSKLIGWAVLVSITTILIRGLWLAAGNLWNARRASAGEPGTDHGWAYTLVLSWSGMRGLVSLATALAVPHFVHAGEPFPHRHLILFLGFGVILITLLGQGITLPALLRRLQLSVDVEDEHARELRARSQLARAALDDLDRIAAEGAVPAAVIIGVRKRHENLLRQLEQAEKEADPGFTSPTAVAYLQTRQRVIAAKRMRLGQLLDDEEVGPELWGTLTWELDVEESQVNIFDVPAPRSDSGSGAMPAATMRSPIPAPAPDPAASPPPGGA
jgi:monovalent cation/hydrogen antiporter